jgi:hypothetical protein
MYNNNKIYTIINNHFDHLNVAEDLMFRVLKQSVHRKNGKYKFKAHQMPHICNETLYQFVYRFTHTEKNNHQMIAVIHNIPFYVNRELKCIFIDYDKDDVILQPIILDKNV